jgi:hypothetical protein
MGVVMITCPNTSRAVSTGIETDASSFASFPDLPMKTKCPLWQRTRVVESRSLARFGRGSGLIASSHRQPTKKAKGYPLSSPFG